MVVIDDYLLDILNHTLIAKLSTIRLIINVTNELSTSKRQARPVANMAEATKLSKTWLIIITTEYRLN